MKKGLLIYKRLFLLSYLFLAFFLQSCLMNYTDDEAIEDAKSYLQENYGGSYTFVKTQKTNSKNQKIVTFKAANLENKNVNVKIDITEQKAFSVSYNISSNYIPQKFKEEEETYYQKIFNNYFSQSKVIINNENRYMANFTYAKADFNNYISFLTDKLDNSKNFITVLAIEAQKDKYISWQDRLKASLVDLKEEYLQLAGDFYLVKNIDDSYKTNFEAKASLQGYSYKNTTTNPTNGEADE